jgi:LysR family transcriptional regulator, hydrogen peroxide-inducible genes activator
MTLTQLSYVVAVAKHRNFGAAADACFVTQPTLSMQIQKLEEELGVLIFDRGQQPVRLTPLGDQIVQQARIALAEAAKIQELTAKELTEVTGQIKIGVIPTLSPYVLPLFIQSFTRKYPEVFVTVEELQTHEMISRLTNDQLDVGLLVTPLHVSTIIEHALFYEPFLLYVSADHPLHKSKKINERDLTFKDVWLLTEGHCFRDQVINLCVDRKRASDKNSNLRFESGSLETLKKMVDQGNGYTLLPLLAAQEIQDPARKKQIKEFNSPVPTREVSLVHSHLYKKRAVVEALCSEIKASLPKNLLDLKEGKFHRVDIPPLEG